MIVRVTEVLRWAEAGDAKHMKPVPPRVAVLGENGTGVHDLIQFRLYNSPVGDVADKLKLGLRAWNDWAELNPWIFESGLVEQTVTQDMGGWAIKGKWDCSVVPRMLDWKTGKPYWWHRWQVNKYANLHNIHFPTDPPITEVVLLYLNMQTGQWVEHKWPYSDNLTVAFDGLAVAYKERRYGDNGTADGEDGTGKVVDSTEILDDRAWGNREV